MFFLAELDRTITLHPSFFGPRIKEYLTSKLLEDVEGTCTGRYYIICVIDTYKISEGRIVPGSGVAEFTVHYRAVVWRPFKGETVDAIVNSVNPQGFFAEVGPLSVFVSSHLIPSDIKFDANATPAQYTDNGDQVIENGTHIRIKLLNTRSDVGNMFAIGSIKEDFLGWVWHGRAVRPEVLTAGLIQDFMITWAGFIGQQRCSDGAAQYQACEGEGDAREGMGACVGTGGGDYDQADGTVR